LRPRPNNLPKSEWRLVIAPENGQKHFIMSEAFADTDPANPYSDSPAAKSAASDLRAAAEGKTPPRTLSATEEKARALKEAAARKASQLRDFAGEKAQDLKTAATDKIGSIREGAEETASQLKGSAGEQWQDTRVKARELHASMEDYVRANPTKAILTAAGIGLILGLISRR
jgi:ElaB/YqjD/DUF883 family membrane-anchored ribosome-binding protein